MREGQNGSFQSRRGSKFEADLSLRRLMPRVNECWEQHEISESIRHEFQVRLEANWESLFTLLFRAVRFSLRLLLSP